MLSNFLLKIFFWSPGRLQNLIKSLLLKLEGGQMYSSSIRIIYKKLYDINIGYGSYGGCFNSNVIPRGVTFGNYCSIAPNIRIFRANHPKDHFTLHPLLYNPIAGYVKKDMLTRPRLTIGNDVWIGEWVIILPSVTYIGNGAIIGAGSIVTKNVDAYTIVAGNPAKKIGVRFNENTIRKIEESNWWLFEKDDLIKKVEYLNELTLGAVNENF